MGHTTRRPTTLGPRLGMGGLEKVGRSRIRKGEEEREGTNGERKFIGKGEATNYHGHGLLMSQGMSATTNEVCNGPKPKKLRFPP